MKKDSVEVQAVNVTYDSIGVAVETWTKVDNLAGVMLPYGTELALKKYGVAETVKYRFFYKGTNANLVAGNRVVYEGNNLYIVYVADYGKAVDVLLNTERESFAR